MATDTRQPKVLIEPARRRQTGQAGVELAEACAPTPAQHTCDQQVAGSCHMQRGGVGGPVQAKACDSIDPEARIWLAVREQAADSRFDARVGQAAGIESLRGAAGEQSPLIVKRDAGCLLEDALPRIRCPHRLTGTCVQAGREERAHAVAARSADQHQAAVRKREMVGGGDFAIGVAGEPDTCVAEVGVRLQAAKQRGAHQAHHHRSAPRRRAPVGRFCPFLRSRPAKVTPTRRPRSASAHTEVTSATMRIPLRVRSRRSRK